MINSLSKKTVLFLFIMFICSCKKDNADFRTISCVLENSIDVLPDSTFMSEAIKMQITGNHIYFIERSSRQLIKLRTDFSINTRIGQWGIGPQDLTEPRNFFLINDSVYIMDAGSRSVKCFSPDNDYIYSFNLEVFSERGVFSERRVFTHNKSLYIASYNKDLKTSMSLLNLTDKKEISRFGESFDFNHPFQNSIRNQRDLLKDHEYFYAVSDNQSVIEKYDLINKEKLESFDYSFVPVIRENIKIIHSKSAAPNSYTAFVWDSYMYNGELYLLVSSHQGDKFVVNTVLRVKLQPNFEINTVYLLPGEIYSTFCIGNDSFYAFNNETASIEKIKRN
jgi:hypothetical protein